MNIKHSILMITYNQEEYISSALDCLLRQGVAPFEVIISDDCSTDKTQDIILEYQKKYPNIIKPIFQKRNLGIYQNLNYIYNSVKLKGDVISFLSGDDLYKDDMLLSFNKYIKDNQLRPRKDKFILMSNTLLLMENGKEVLALNNYASKDKNWLKLKLRNRIGNRYTGISMELYKAMGDWNLNVGLWSDALHTFDLYTRCEKIYFIKKAFPMYRQGSGITSKIKTSELDESWIKVANFILKNRAVYLDKQDVVFLKKSILKSELLINNSVNNKLKFLKFYILSFTDILSGHSSFKSYLFELNILLPKNIRLALKKIPGVRNG